MKARRTHRDHEKAIYRVNCALQACARRDATEVQRYLSSLTQFVDTFPDIPAYALLIRARLEGMSGDNKASHMLFHDAYAESLEAGRPRAAAYAQLNISSNTLDGKLALEAALEALRLFVKFGDAIGISEAALNAGVLYAGIGQHDNAEASMRKALEIKRSEGHPYGIGTALLNLASLAIDQADYDSGLMLATQSVQCLIELQQCPPSKRTTKIWQTTGWTDVAIACEPLLATAHNNLGNVHAYLGDSGAAIENYMRAHELMTHAGNVRGAAIVLNQIGDTFREMGEYAHAEEFFRASSQAFEEAGVQGFMYGMSLQGIGEACAGLNRYIDATHFYDAALKEYQQINNVAAEAEVMTLKGELLVASGKGSDAVLLLKQALTRAQSVSSMAIVVRGNRVLGRALLRVDSTQACEHLELALLLAEEYRMKPELKLIHHELSSYYGLVGESTQALSHFKRFHELDREIHSEEADRRVRQFEILQRVEHYKRSAQELASRVTEIETQLQEKTDELVSLAQRIMEKHEFIRLMEQGLKGLLVADHDAKNKIAKELLRELATVGDAKHDFDEIMRKFLSIHREFAQKLMAEAPNLTQTEFQVCVLKRLSMDAKQIAQVLEIEPSTAFNHQQSIRTKLGLINRENLKNYLLQLDVSNGTQNHDT